MPRPPQHSVEVGLERVANWNCHAAGENYGTLRPRKTYRGCVTAPELTEPLTGFRNDQIRIFAVQSGNGRGFKNNRSACWVFPVAVGIALAVAIVIALLTLESRLSELHGATIRADVDHVSLAIELRSERSRAAHMLARYRRSVAEMKAELRALKAEQSKQQALLLGGRHEVDHASSLLGGQIEATPRTEELLSRGPAHLLQPANELGHCWGFYGPRGVAVIRLATPVKVTHVAVVHLGRSVAAPKDFNLAGLEGDAHFPLGEFRYDLDHGAERQEFPTTANQDRAFERVQLEVTSNHGYPYTCVYRLQVYGQGEAGVPRRS